MVQITELGPAGLPTGKYGSFAGKEASSGAGPHNPDQLTELAPFGLPIGKYGSFAGKEPSVPAVATEVFGSGGQPWWLGRKPYRVKRREPDLRDALLRRNRALTPDRTNDAEDTPGRIDIALGLPIATTLERLLTHASAQPAVILPRPLPRIAPTHLVVDDHEELRLMALLA